MRQLFEADIVIDGTGAAPIEKGAVLVDARGRVEATGRQAEIGRPDGVRVTTAAPGATLIPGLIDSHVHLAYSANPDKAKLRAERMDLNYPEVALRAVSLAQKSLVHGFTALRDMHAPGGTMIDLRDAIEAGDVVGPRIRACGRGLTVTGGHMDVPFYAEHAEMSNFSHTCDGPDEFRKGVRMEQRRGADFIKINSCVSLRSRPGTWWRPEMSPEEIRAACDEAHAQDLFVAAHTSGGPPLTATIANGVDCVEHAHWIDDDCIELMVKQGSYLVPTLLVNEINFEIPLETQGLKKHSDWSLASREAKWVSLEKARKAGIKVGAGTDAGFMVPHSTMHWRELQLLVQGGYSILEAITCATSVNAEIMKLNVGSLTKGRFADMVVVDGDLLGDLSLLADPKNLTVFKDGIKVAEKGELLSFFPHEVAA
jgi:imidazolonepropionase-like amidohydrolase